MTLLVSTRALGKRRALLDDFSVPPPPDDSGGRERTLRDVIEHVVRHQVKEFEKRRDARRFDRVLSAARIEKDAKRGKVDPGAKDLQQGPVDVEYAVGNALQAFEDGLYLVIIDEVERKTLEETVRLTEDSRMVFLRLTFLAGA